MIAEYISANQFRVEEDRTGEFKTGRRIKAYCGVDGYVYSTILSSSYSDPYTTITIVENVLTSNLEDVLYGIVNIGETGAFPDHLHDGTEGQGGALPHITTTEFSTYSGTLQTQIDNKPDTFLELIDTPSFYDSGKYARSTSSGIVWATAGQTFLDLTDTPTTYSGHTGKHLKVTSSGIDFIQLPAYNMFTAASGLPVSGNPLDSYLNFNTGDIYAYALGASFYNNTKFNIASMPHAASRTLSGAASNVSDGSTLTFWQDDINTNQWVSIDLGASKNIWKICLTGYQAYDTRMPNNFRIEASSDNSNWNTIYTGIAVSNSSIDQFFIFPTPSPPYRYWRLYVIDNWGDTWLLLSKFELYEGYESNSYSWQVRGNITPSFIKLTDAPHTYADSVGKYPQSTGSGIAWATPIIVENRIPVATDGIVNNIFIDSLHNDVYKKVVETSATTVNYWRLYISVCNDTYCDISTFELRPTVGGADQAYNSGGTATSNSFWGTGYDASKAFDNDSGSFWSTGVVNPCWIQYQFTTAKSVSEIYLKPRSGFLSRMPRDFKLQCSSDGVNWQDRGSWTNQTNWLDAGRTFYIDTLYSGWDIVLDTKNSFNELLDAPSTYSGTAGKFAQSTGSGIVWATVSGLEGGSSNYAPDLTANLSYSGSSFSSTAGENLLFGDVCYLKNDGKFWKARASSEATSKGLLSLSIGSINTNSQGTFLQVGYIRNDAWNFTVGSELFIPTISGGPTGTVPSAPGNIIRIVGNAYDTNIVWFCPDQTYIELSAITSSGISFLNLSDVPTTYSGTKGMFAQSTGSGIIWAAVSGSGSSDVQTFLDLTDTPNEYSIGKFAQSTASGIVWATASGSSAQTFIELTDTPFSYAGQEGKFVKVVGNALEFATVSGLEGAYDSSWFFELDENGGLMPSTGSGILDIQSFLDLTDTPNIYSDGLYAKSTASGIVWATVSGSGSSNVQSFLDLTDTPTTYSGHTGKHLKVTISGIDFVQLPAYNMFTAASGLPVSGNPLDSYLNLSTGDIYACALGASFYSNTKFNITSMSHVASKTLSGNVINLSDGSTGTFWQDDINTNQWVSIDLGQAKNIWKICLTGYQGYNTRMPKNFRIEGSSNNSDWTTIYTGIGVADSSTNQFFVFSTPSEPYRYWRLYMIDNWGDTWLLLSKFELYEGYTSNNYSWQIQGNVRTTPAFKDLTDVPSTYSGTLGKFAQSTGSGIVWSDVQSDPPTSGTWNFEGATLSGTGDVYCGDIYLNNAKMSIEDNVVLVEGIDSLADEYTVLMLHMDGSNNSTIFTDSAPHNYQVTAVGNAHISTTLSKFGGASALFDGTDDRITIPATADFSFGTSPFTIDFWINFNSLSGFQYFFDIGDDNSEFYYYSGIWYIKNPNSTTILSYAYTPTIDIWYHVAIGRNGNTWYLFIDGVLKTTSSSSAAFGISNLVFTIGNYGGGGGYGVNGYMDEFRVSKGILRWSESFTPPSHAYVESTSSFSKELSYTDHIHTFIDLTDTPSTYSGTKGMFAQSTGSGIVWATVSGSSSSDIQTFLDLTDTPNTYSDGLYAQSTTSGIVWATVSGGSGASSFIDLTDTPNSYSNGKFAQSTEDGIVWTTVSGGGTGTSYGELELTYASDIVLDFTEYNLQSVILTGNTNFTFTNMTNGKPCVLNVIQDAQGSRSATFQSNIRWPQGVIPTTSSGSGLYDIFTFIQSRGTICGSCSAAFQLGS